VFTRARSIQSIPPYSITLRSILTSAHLGLGLPSGFFPSGVFAIFYMHSSSPIRATCPANLVLLDLITVITLGEEYKL
jgi:hypothetical protein